MVWESVSDSQLGQKRTLPFIPQPRFPFLYISVSEWKREASFARIAGSLCPFVSVSEGWEKLPFAHKVFSSSPRIPLFEAERVPSQYYSVLQNGPIGRDASFLPFPCPLLRSILRVLVFVSVWRNWSFCGLVFILLERQGEPFPGSFQACFYPSLSPCCPCQPSASPSCLAWKYSCRRAAFCGPMTPARSCSLASRMRFTLWKAFSSSSLLFGPMPLMVSISLAT